MLNSTVCSNLYVVYILQRRALSLSEVCEESGRLTMGDEGIFQLPSSLDIMAEFCGGSASVPRGFVSVLEPEPAGNLSCDNYPVTADSNGNLLTECSEVDLRM